MLNFESLLILSRGQLFEKKLLFDNRQVTRGHLKCSFIMSRMQNYHFLKLIITNLIKDNQRIIHCSLEEVLDLICYD